MSPVGGSNPAPVHHAWMRLNPREHEAFCSKTCPSHAQKTGMAPKWRLRLVLSFSRRNSAGRTSSKSMPYPLNEPRSALSLIRRINSCALRFALPYKCLENPAKNGSFCFTPDCSRGRVF